MISRGLVLAPPIVNALGGLLIQYSFQIAKTRFDAAKTRFDAAKKLVTRAILLAAVSQPKDNEFASRGHRVGCHPHIVSSAAASPLSRRWRRVRHCRWGELEQSSPSASASGQIRLKFSAIRAKLIICSSLGQSIWAKRKAVRLLVLGNQDYLGLVTRFVAR